MLKLSSLDDGDAFDPADFSPEELEQMLVENDERFDGEYKSFYDDIKTGKKCSEEDW